MRKSSATPSSEIVAWDAYILHTCLVSSCTITVHESSLVPLILNTFICARPYAFHQSKSLIAYRKDKDPNAQASTLGRTGSSKEEGFRCIAAQSSISLLYWKQFLKKHDLLPQDYIHRATATAPWSPSQRSCPKRPIDLFLLHHRHLVHRSMQILPLDPADYGALVVLPRVDSVPQRSNCREACKDDRGVVHAGGGNGDCGGCMVSNA